MVRHPIRNEYCLEVRHWIPLHISTSLATMWLCPHFVGSPYFLKALLYKYKVQRKGCEVRPMLSTEAISRLTWSRSIWWTEMSLPSVLMEDSYIIMTALSFFLHNNLSIPIWFINCNILITIFNFHWRWHSHFLLKEMDFEKGIV